MTPDEAHEKAKLLVDNWLKSYGFSSVIRGKDQIDLQWRIAKALLQERDP